MQIFGLTVLFPMTFVSNVFVPVETILQRLRGVAEHNPISRLADAARGLLVCGPVVGPAVFAPLLSWALSRRLTQGYGSGLGRPGRLLAEGAGCDRLRRHHP